MRAATVIAVGAYAVFIVMAGENYDNCMIPIFDNATAELDAKFPTGIDCTKKIKETMQQALENYTNVTPPDIRREKMMTAYQVALDTFKECLKKAGVSDADIDSAVAIINGHMKSATDKCHELTK